MDWAIARRIYRSAGACPPRSLVCLRARRGPVVRGPVPRDRGMARDRPSPYGNPGRFFHRSAGACPPRVLACPRAWRGTGPRPTVTRDVFFHRSAGACPPRSRHGGHPPSGPRPTVRRGPLCRSRSPDLDPFGSRRSRTMVFYRIWAWRGTGPRPTVTRGVFFIVARGPVPRDRGMARGTRSHARVASEGPSPTVTGGVFFP